MSIFDHRNSDGVCIWDHEMWPCTTARILIEASDAIRTSPYLIDYTDDHMSDMNEAADYIDPRN